MIRCAGIGIGMVVVIGCFGCDGSSSDSALHREAAPVSNGAPSSDGTSQSGSTTDETLSVSASEVAGKLYLQLLFQAFTYPEVDPIDHIGRGSGWTKLSDEVAAMSNAKVAYVGRISDLIVMVAGDGSSDSFSITIESGFDNQSFLDLIDDAYDRRSWGEEKALGQELKIYRLIDHGTELGLLAITTSVISSEKGRATISFVSVDGARRAGIGAGG